MVCEEYRQNELRLTRCGLQVLMAQESEAKESFGQLEMLQRTHDKLRSRANQLEATHDGLFSKLEIVKKTLMVSNKPELCAHPLLKSTGLSTSNRNTCCQRQVHAIKTKQHQGSVVRASPKSWPTPTTAAAGEKGGNRVRTTSGQTPGGAASNRQAASERDDHEGDDRVHSEANNEGMGLFSARAVCPALCRCCLFLQTRADCLHDPITWAAFPRPFRASPTPGLLSLSSYLSSLQSGWTEGC